MKSRSRHWSKASHKNSSRSMRLVLEPRMVFDGSVADTAAEALQDNIDNSGNPTVAPASEANVDFAPVIDTAPVAGEIKMPPVFEAITDLFADQADAVASPNVSPQTSIVFIDSAVDDPDSIVEAIDPAAEIVYLDGKSSGLTQVAEYLNNRSGIDNIQIISHSQEATLILGNETLTNDNLAAHAEQLAAIGKALTDNGDILLYGCELAKSTDGAEFINRFADLTSADVAASTDITGAADNNYGTSDTGNSHMLDLSAVPETSTTTVSDASRQAQQLISRFVQNTNNQQLFDLFNGGQSQASASWLHAADSLRQSIVTGDYSIKVQFLSNDAMQGAKGAFAAKGPDGTPVIYLNRDWLARGADSGSITRVLVEELGHSFDALLNPESDTQGDEGERFAARVVDGSTHIGNSLNDDHAIFQIDGKSIDVEMANYTFVNAYEMVYDLNLSGAVQGNLGETDAAKEQNSHNFDYANPLGKVTVTDGTGNRNFSGNDVSAISVTINGTTYYGWISRPIKSGGVVRGFYFWTDDDFTTLALAQADGNQDTDAYTADNRGFLLVVDQAWFTSQITSTTTAVSGTGSDINGRALPVNYAKIGSSSDRVDSALNELVDDNVAPVANNDSGTAVEQGYNSNTSTTITATVNATGNVLTNDTDVNSDTLTVTQIVSGSKGTTASVTGSTNVVGKYGTLTIGTDGAYSYAVDNSNTTVDALLAGNVSEVFT